MGVHVGRGIFDLLGEPTLSHICYTIPKGTEYFRIRHVCAARSLPVELDSYGIFRHIYVEVYVLLLFGDLFIYWLINL